MYVKLCNFSRWKSGFADSTLSQLFAAESAQLADFMADTFQGIPLAVCSIPTAFPIDSRFCQVHISQACLMG